MNWTMHAARRVLQRGLDPATVLRLAQAAQAAGFGRDGKSARFRQGDTVVVVAHDTIITVYRRDRKRRK
jgi:propanediol dehydratase small subunit